MAYTHYYFESDSSKYDTFIKYRPRILYTGLVKNVKNWHSKNNSHGFYELLFIFEDSGTISKNYVNASDIVIYHPSVIHREQASTDNPFHFTFLAFEVSKAYIRDQQYNWIRQSKLFQSTI